MKHALTHPFRAILLIAVLLSAVGLLYAGAGTPHSVLASKSVSITPSSRIVHPGEQISITGKGFNPGETVNIYIDSTQSQPVGSLTCDNSGSCAGTAVMPFSFFVQGQHILFGQGQQSGLVAEASIKTEAGIYLFIGSGGPGTVNDVYGASFAANESVKVYWGLSLNLLLGYSITTSYGDLNFSFNVPLKVTPGNYPVTVVRSHQTPPQLTAIFTLLPVKFKAQSSTQYASLMGYNGSLSGYQAYENIIISWNANGGQVLQKTSANSFGSIPFSIEMPSAPPGTYTVTALGVKSKLQSSRSLTYEPGITYTPQYTNPGNTLTVTGGGFIPGNNVQVYFQTPSNGVVNATPDATGYFKALLTVPSTFKSGTHYFVYAVSSSQSVRKPFFFTDPSVGPNGLTTYGLRVPIAGSYFAAYEMVKVYWQYGNPGQKLIAAVKANLKGDFSFYYHLPSVPYQTEFTIGAIGQTSGLFASGTTIELPGLVLKPTSGPIGTLVTINGGDFGANETVTLSFQGNTIGTATTDSTGFFSTTFTIPSSAPLGSTTIQATGNTSGASASATFKVTQS